eukprot:GFUD01131242.1.p1 GENE.GFUD01131242.1~~GFUD01131242.1.p1  ORF type:complete len:583 (+),score=171.20 GFUD01131242.1:51-1799(+)
MDMDSAGEIPSQSRRSLRKKSSVLYDQDMIDGDTSMEGLVDDEEEVLSKGEKAVVETGHRIDKTVEPTGKLSPGHDNLSTAKRSLVRGKHQTGRFKRESVKKNHKQTSKRNLHCRKKGKVISPESIERPFYHIIDEDTPRRSARCTKPSKKMIQIKKELQEVNDCDKEFEDLQIVRKSTGKRILKCRVPYDNHKTRLGDKTQCLKISKPEKLVSHIRRSPRISKPTRQARELRKPEELVHVRRSPRISKPTKEILEFRNNIKADDEKIGSGSGQIKSKLMGDSVNNSRGNIKTRNLSGQCVKEPVNQNCSQSPTSGSCDNIDTDIASSESPHQASSLNLSWDLEKSGQSNTSLVNASKTSLDIVNQSNSSISGKRLVSSAMYTVSSPGITNQSKLPPPIRREVYKPPSSGKLKRKQGTSVELCSSGTSSVTPVKVRSSKELLERESDAMEDDVGALLRNTSMDGEHSNSWKNSLIVLTESDDTNDDNGDHIVPAAPAPMKLSKDPRNWNCVQCVYQLTRLDERLAMTDLGPLLEMKVDGDALVKSSLSDLVNVVGLEYSPAVRVVFQIQQMCKEVALGERDD